MACPSHHVCSDTTGAAPRGTGRAGRRCAGLRPPSPPSPLCRWHCACALYILGGHPCSTTCVGGLGMPDHALWGNSGWGQGSHTASKRPASLARKRRPSHSRTHTGARRGPFEPRCSPPACPLRPTPPRLRARCAWAARRLTSPDARLRGGVLLLLLRLVSQQDGEGTAGAPLVLLGRLLGAAAVVVGGHHHHRDMVGWGTTPPWKAEERWSEAANVGRQRGARENGDG